MKTSNKGKAIIKQYEGFRAKPYLCPAGVPTIGYGATYYTDGRKVTLKDAPISEADADKLLDKMLAKYEDAVNRYVQVPITQNQFDALVSFCYNLGQENLRNSTLLKKVNAKDYKGAADAFLNWVYASGKKLQGLVNRRTDERNGMPYYVTRVQVTKDELKKLDGLKLKPGMPVETFIKTGERSMLSYLVKPLRDQLYRAFRHD